MGVALGARNPVFGWSDPPVAHETWTYLFLRQGASTALWGTRLKIVFFGAEATSCSGRAWCVHQMPWEGAKKREMKGSSTLQSSLLTI